MMINGLKREETSSSCSFSECTASGKERRPCAKKEHKPSTLECMKMKQGKDKEISNRFMSPSEGAALMMKRFKGGGCLE
ncbi:hypothetical protein [Fodinibius sediminis]|uniref:hypothetical protein n=1 Tax=Fodinibius sediminis TaxID=1214077 RepID=UPI00163DBC39|nr:hypothetical protein [Fodinibius sediminis]